MCDVLTSDVRTCRVRTCGRADVDGGRRIHHDHQAHKEHEKSDLRALGALCVPGADPVARFLKRVLFRHPGGHGSLIVDDGGLDRVEQRSAIRLGRVHDFLDVDDEAVTAVRELHPSRSGW
jgi:hypothetical protein